MSSRTEVEPIIELSTELLASEDLFSVPDRRSRRKWSRPWWHMALLCEMGEAERIPKSTAERAMGLLKNGAWPRFVIAAADAPQTDGDREKMDCCHCELGVFYRLLSECGCDVDAELPWMRNWFLQHQLPDGGLNCEPSAYGGSRKSSIVSTLPPIEAILYFTPRPFTDAESRFLDEGARYLIEHRLICSKKDGGIINKEWLKPLFPRFFEYDLLRGLAYLAEWSKRREQPLPETVIAEGLGRLKPYIGKNGVILGRHVNDRTGGWNGRTFPLLKSVSRVGKTSPYLARQLDTVLHGVQKADRSGTGLR